MLSVLARGVYFYIVGGEYRDLTSKDHNNNNSTAKKKTFYGFYTEPCFVYFTWQ
jgi:hypothetical protein